MGPQGKRKSAESVCHEAEADGCESRRKKQVKKKKAITYNVEGDIRAVKYLIMTFKGALGKISSFFLNIKYL